MESCGMNIMKYLLFVFNFLFVVSGIGLIVAGGVVLYEAHQYNQFVDGTVLGPPIVMIIVGTIIFVIAFLGCCGAIKENYNMLIAFAVLLLIVFIVELAVGIAASVNKEEFGEVLKSTMKKTMGNSTHQNDLDLKAWDAAQKRLKCCGVDSSSDWSVSHPEFAGAFPGSCCEGDVQGNTCTLPYKDGCLEKVQKTMKDGAIVLMGVGIGLAFIQIAGIIFAFCLATAIKKGEEEK